MRLAILLLLVVSCWSAEKPTQSEQDAMWAKAMEESAKVKPRPRDTAGLVVLAPTARPTAQEPKTNEQQMAEIRDAFQARWGIPYECGTELVNVIDHVPERFHGSLYSQINESDQFRLIGSLSHEFIDLGDGERFIIGSMRVYSDAGVSFVDNRRKTEHVFRNTKVIGYVSETVIRENFPQMSYVYRLVK